MGKAGARHPRRRNPARREARRQGGPGPRGNRLTPAFPTRQRQQQPAPELLRAAAPDAAEQKASTSCSGGKSTRWSTLLGFSGTSPLEKFGQLYSIFIFRSSGAQDRHRGLPKWWMASTEITSGREGVTPESVQNPSYSLFSCRACFFSPSTHHL